MEMNINRFGFDKNLATIYALNQALDNDETFDQFKAKANDILGRFNHTFLETEYNMAIAVAQNASNWNRQKAQANLFPYLKYQTVGDQNVRPAHAALDGKVFAVADDTWQDIYPPNGFNCRCEMLQLRGDEVFEPVTKGPEAKALLGAEYDLMKKTGFAVNRGETKEVFNLNKAYITDLPDSHKVDIAKLTYKDAGLPDYDSFKAGLKPLEKKLQAFPETEALEVADYHGRPISLSRKTYEKQSAALFGNVAEVLRKPSEVYVNEYVTGKFEYRFIKFYQDSAILVTVRLDANGMKVFSWAEAVPDEVRKGFLIKRK